MHACVRVQTGLRKSDSLSQLSGVGSSLLGAGGGGCCAEEKQLSFAYSVGTGAAGGTGVLSSSAGGGVAGSSALCGPGCLGVSQRRLVIVGVEGRSLSEDARLLRWARRQVVRPEDVVVLVSCWELASDARFLRVPGMILVSTSGACDYNKAQQRAVTQRLRGLAQQNLPNLKVYPLALPVGKASFVSRLRNRLAGCVRWGQVRRRRLALCVQRGCGRPSWAGCSVRCLDS